ncbi:hypothetical protein HPB52_023565 [Rhipicephalus sanguineus]|uniref:Uncharacterized protein n=1 Tax=Rhipicephalus sanguineus TaxID=34632 RepID=A0A9D4PGY9_RHISA|nr:hypothetical protein HPB52_023565 [Rhipicephalus sanguineus]
MYYPSRGALYLQGLPLKQQCAQPFYASHVLLMSDPGGRISGLSSFKAKRVPDPGRMVSSSCSFKRRRVDDRYSQQQRCYDQHSTGHMHSMAAYGATKYRKKMAPYTREKHWIGSRYATHPQQYAVHTMQEPGGSEACQGAGDTVVVKSAATSPSTPPWLRIR